MYYSYSSLVMTKTILHISHEIDMPCHSGGEQCTMIVLVTVMRNYSCYDHDSICSASLVALAWNVYKTISPLHLQERVILPHLHKTAWTNLIIDKINEMGRKDRNVLLRSSYIQVSVFCSLILCDLLRENRPFTGFHLW